MSEGNIMTLVARHGRIKLTVLQRRILREGAEHPRGVVRPLIGAGFAGVTTRKAVAKLEALGLIVPNPHGDHYITDEGHAVLGEAE